MNFQTRLRELRKNKKVNQTTLGKEIGVTLKQVQRYESGENEPTLSILRKLSDYFDVSIDYLTGKSDDPYVAVACAIPNEFHKKIFLELEKIGISQEHITQKSTRAAVVGEGFIVDGVTPAEADKIARYITACLKGVDNDSYN